MRVAADEPVEQALQVGSLRVCDGLRMQPVQAVDGLLAQAEGAVDIALAGTLRIGTIESIMTASFGEILPLYHERCPHVNTQLVEGDTKTLSDMLMHNEVDLIYTLDDMGYDAQRVKLFECPQEICLLYTSPSPRD